MIAGFYELPSSWRWVRVDEVGAVQLGRQRSPEHHSGEHMRPYLRVANVYENRIDTRDVLQMNFTPAEAERFSLRYGDILLNEGQSRELVGRPAMFRDEVPGACFQNTLVRFRANQNVLPGYALNVFRYYLRAGYFQAICKWTTNIAHLGAERFAAMPFPLAPLPEQKRMVDKINALLARVDACRERLARVPTILKRFRQSVLAAATSGALTREWREEQGRIRDRGGSDLTITKGTWPVPDTWQWTTAESVCAFITKGATPSKDRMSASRGDVPFIKVYNLTFDGRLDFSIDPTFVDTRTHRGDLKRSIVIPGDVLWNIVGPPLGKVAVVPDSYSEWNINQAIARFRPGPLLTSAYLALCMMDQRTIDHASRQAKATAGQFNLTLKICRSIPIPLPPVEEQREIARRVAELFGFVGQLEEGIARSRRAVEKLTPSVLARAFRGELAPQDPENEPASKLLAQIRASRDGADSKKPKPGQGARRPRPRKESATMDQDPE
jgi:type I restriction enzyme S subunit